MSFQDDVSTLVEQSKFKLLFITLIKLLFTLCAVSTLAYVGWNGYTLFIKPPAPIRPTLPVFFQQLGVPVFLTIVSLTICLIMQLVERDTRQTADFRLLFDSFSRHFWAPIVKEVRTLETRTNLDAALGREIQTRLSVDQRTGAELATWLKQYDPKAFEDMLTMLRGTLLFRQEQSRLAQAQIDALMEDILKQEVLLADLERTEETQQRLLQQCRTFLAEHPNTNITTLPRRS